MEKERRQKLEWFIQFSNMDLDKLRPGDKAKLEVEAPDNLFPRKELEEITIPQQGASHPRFPLYGFETYLPKWILEPLTWDTINELQTQVKNVLSSLSQRKEDRPGALTFPTKTNFIFNWNDRFRLSKIPLPTDHETYIALKIYDLVNGLSTDVIQKCKACGKYFLKPNRRKKLFCSYDCNWKYHGQIYRQNENYKKRKRNSQWKRYPKDLERKLGRRVKVKRRINREE